MKQSSIFSNLNIPADTQVLFVCDMFAKDYEGGAELTTQALIDSSPYRIATVHCKDINPNIIQNHVDKFWIFGNFSGLHPQLVPLISNHIRYAILEYDYKFCQYRSTEKHSSISGTPCDCSNSSWGKMIENFYENSECIFYMSEMQKDKIVTALPKLIEKDNIVLSSVFDSTFFSKLESLREKTKDIPKQGALILGSDSWVKGKQKAIDYCQAHGIEYEIVWGLPYDKLLEKLSTKDTFVYLPQGSDTCPRMTIEAKLLGLKLILNDDVQQRHEPWFSTNDITTTEDYLKNRPAFFWNRIGSILEHQPSLSGYTTARDLILNRYEWKPCIKTLLHVCDEVIVVDNGSKDETIESIKSYARELNKEDILRIIENPVDWSAPNFAIEDGRSKGLARSCCTREFCLQMDMDEYFEEEDWSKVRDMLKTFPKGVDILSLPMMDWWGPNKVRLDVAPAKWRLSRNNPDITHGIPKSMRIYDNEGRLYAKPGCDGCEMISIASGELLPHIALVSEQSERARQLALQGNEQARRGYELWYRALIKAIPTVRHSSWRDIKTKLLRFRDYWSLHWDQLYRPNQKRDQQDAEINLFFHKPWNEVSDQEIETMAKRLEQETGGWVFHQPWNGQKTPWITLND